MSDQPASPVLPESVAAQKVQAIPPAPLVKAAPEAGPAPDKGRVTLAVKWPVGSLTVPPLSEGGDSVVIDENGTEVDDATAARARHAAALAGFTLQES